MYVENVERISKYEMYICLLNNKMRLEKEDGE
jgi:hypothetical protein